MIRRAILSSMFLCLSVGMALADDCGVDRSTDGGIDRVICKDADRGVWGAALETFGIRNFQKSYALVIGVSDFDGYTNLPTKSDPVRMQQYLIEEAGFDYVHILTDDAATLPRIRELMVGSFPETMTNSDRFLFYWSGHGVTRDTQAGQNGYLPVSSTPYNAYPQMISMREIDEWNDLIPASQVLFLLDSCFSGLAGLARKSDLQELTAQQLSGPARHILTAGTAGEETIAIDRLGGSVFTAAVIDGLRGAAEATNGLGQDGLISINELQNYVTLRVAIERDRANWPKPITPQLRDIGISEGAFFFRVPGSEGPVQPPVGTGDATVRFIQENLPALGYDPGEATGELNMTTQLALIRFQTEKGLVRTGQPDDLTRVAMLQALADLDPETGITPQGGTEAPGSEDPGSAPVPAVTPLQTPCPECPTFKTIAASSFQMGYDLGRPDFGPAVNVRLPSFALSATEVTKAQYAVFAEEFGLDFVNAKTEQQPSCYEWTEDKQRLRRTGYAYGQLSGDPDEPVACVSFKDAIGYIDWLNTQVPGTPFRLPTEAELEWALRAGLPNQTDMFNGADAASGFSWRATGYTDAHPGVAPVASYAADANGLFDIRGNLWEWSADCWTDRHQPDRYAAQPGFAGHCADGAAVVKGGSFDDPTANFASYVRQPAPLSRRQENIGFRVAYDVN